MTAVDVHALLQPIGLNREQAAAFVCAGTTLFDEMVADGRMPPPRLMNARTVWDREELYLAFKALPHRQSKERAPKLQDDGPVQVDWAKVSR